MSLRLRLTRSYSIHRPRPLQVAAHERRHGIVSQHRPVSPGVTKRQPTGPFSRSHEMHSRTTSNCTQCRCMHRQDNVVGPASVPARHNANIDAITCTPIKRVRRENQEFQAERDCTVVCAASVTCPITIYAHPNAPHCPSTVPANVCTTFCAAHLNSACTIVCSERVTL